ADATNVVAVEVGDRRWSRDGATWTTPDPADLAPLDPGTLRVHVAVPDAS
ncbi:hypothetical protein G8C60_13845, partial [Cellulosimicrobium cellulans]|nr:hypothetical protein [Cellulosimicrobium cellulans]